MGLRLAHPSPLGVESISSGCHAATVTDRVSVRLSGEQFAFVGGEGTRHILELWYQNLICTCDPYLVAYIYLLKFSHLKPRP